MDNQNQKHKRSFASITITTGTLIAIAVSETFAATINFLWTKCLDRWWNKNKTTNSSMEELVVTVPVLIPQGVANGASEVPSDVASHEAHVVDLHEVVECEERLHADALAAAENEGLHHVDALV
jgi:hypothetical protein